MVLRSEGLQRFEQYALPVVRIENEEFQQRGMSWTQTGEANKLSMQVYEGC